MVNSQVIKEIENAFKIDSQVSNIPNPIPTIEVGIKKTKPLSFITTECTAATSATALTTSSTQDTYIKGIFISHIRDVNATALYYGVTAVIDGQTVFLIKIPTKSAVNFDTPIESVITFDNPIKVDRNSIIAVVNSTNVAISRTIASIYYYIDEIN